MVDSRDDKSSRRRRSRSRERRRRSRTKSKSRSRSRERRGRDSSRERRRSHSPRDLSPDLTPSERDARTVFAWQLSARIRQSDLEKFFGSVGKIRCVKLIMDNKTRRSKGIAYIEFREVESAQLALSLTGTRLLGVPIQVNYVTERADMGIGGSISLDNEETDRTGVGLGPTGRLALMAKLAEGTGLQIPKSAMTTLQNCGSGSVSSAVSAAHAAAASYAPPVCTQCFVLSNMFDPKSTPNAELEEIKEDVLDECSKIGGVLHIYLDKNNPSGNIYVKSTTITAATQCVDLLHGRYFSGRMVSACFVPLNTYHNLFPASTTANTLLKPMSANP